MKICTVFGESEVIVDQRQRFVELGINCCALEDDRPDLGNLFSSNFVNELVSVEFRDPQSCQWNGRGVTVAFVPSWESESR